VDDAGPNVQVTGAWTRFAGRGQYGPSALRYSGSGGSGGSVRFVPNVSTTGRYAVYLYWPRVDSLATRVPVTIRHADGTERLTVNLRAPSETAQGGIAQWARVGEFRFAAGRDAWVELGTDGADGVVVADAVLLVPVSQGSAH